VIFMICFNQSITTFFNVLFAFRRVDHYLGKQAVQQIVPFRLNNPMIDNMLNADFVERIDIVMKEQIGVKGTLGFLIDSFSAKKEH